MMKWLKVAGAVGSPLLAATAFHLARRGEGSLRMRLAASVIRSRGKPLARLDEFRAAVERRKPPSPAPLPKKLAGRFTVRDQRISTSRVVTLTPKSSPIRCTIIYLHGGAYVNDLVKPHWDIIAALSSAAGATMVVPIYPLAPERTNEDAFALLEAVYRQVLDVTSASNIVLAGDSAGGGLALALAVELRDKALPLPARLVLFAPWLDLTLADPAAREVESSDVMLTVDALRLCGKWWAGMADARAPRFSPLYGDLKGLPPIDIYQGSQDLLVADARSFVTKAQAAGNQISYREYPGGFHVFMAATFVPEAKDVFRRVGLTLSGIDEGDHLPK
ncbi:alpha/beta hydrolase fold domain-containing protein [Parafrankia sp. BMG5.11]|uniref:alpha/beta hydrolase fold domain-containing protein n=1 Tax=Parafrankia sp. BMG5.11 TaxID=222540 RepID=UPI0014044175|nr:alpha/beta hydrolase [Parafrankia sp. BMG5.11]